MQIGPMAFTSLIAGGIAGGSVAGMAATDGEGPRKVLMGTVVGGGAATAVTGLVGFVASGTTCEKTVRPPLTELTGMAKWAHTPGITGMTKMHQTWLAAGAITIGVVAAALAANLVLDVNKDSLTE